MNQITIQGNLVRNPELRFTRTGVPVANFAVASNRKVGDREEATYFEVQAWRDLAEHLSCLAQGDRVVVVGSFSQESWETEEGQKRSKLVVVAFEVAVSLRFATATPKKVYREPTTSATENQDTEEEEAPF